ncbi:MAG TPA: GNAT family N-acetyltransferase [Anaerolineaceae bacterium]|nr:GNAT family N-acetyltransferase [Anaerolineaceae bacterium]
MSELLTTNRGQEMQNNVAVRPLQVSHLPVVAAIHMRAFPDSALSKLGAEAVRRYYEWQLTGPHDVHAVGAFTGDRLAGFCFGGRFRGALVGFLRKNRAYLSFLVLRKPWLLFNPLFRERLAFGLRTYRRRFSGQQSAAVPVTGGPAPYGILSIAVDPLIQGKGIGRALMQDAEQVARRAGFTEMVLTVHHDNVQAIRFYEKLDWFKTPGNGAWKGEMRKEI